MKTAIAVPDAVFDQVERRVKALGMSRSEFFSRAAENYLRTLDEKDLTARIDAAIALAGEEAQIEQREFSEFGLESLGRDHDDASW